MQIIDHLKTMCPHCVEQGCSSCRGGDEFVARDCDTCRWRNSGLDVCGHCVEDVEWHTSQAVYKGPVMNHWVERKEQAPHDAEPERVPTLCDVEEPVNELGYTADELDGKGDGSGAMKADGGKAPMSFIPVALVESFHELYEVTDWAAYDCLVKLSTFATEGAERVVLMDALASCTESLGGPVEAFSGCAKAMEFGAIKYDRGNWRNGFEDSRLIDASMRHILSYLTGEQFDPESGNDHRFHAMFGMSVVLDQIRRRERYDVQVGANDLI